MTGDPLTGAGGGGKSQFLAPLSPVRNANTPNQPNLMRLSNLMIALASAASLSPVSAGAADLTEAILPMFQPLPVVAASADNELTEA